MASTGPVDPLHAFRLAIQRKKSIKLLLDSAPSKSLASCTHISFGSILSFPKSTPTRLRKPTAPANVTDPYASERDFFNLGAVWLAWELREASAAEYMKRAREEGVHVAGMVSVTERKGLVEWLKGEKLELDNIVVPAESTTPPGSPTGRSAYLGPTPGASSTRTSTSRPSASSRSAGAAAELAALGLGGETSLKRKYQPDTADLTLVKRIRQNEVELRDRNTVLRGVKPNNFSALRGVWSEKLKKIREASKAGGGATNASSPAVGLTSKPDQKVGARKQKQNYPIILISSSPTALINMYNVKKFFEEAMFETPAVARASAPQKPEDLIAIYRKRTTIDPSGRETTTHARYFVVDGVEALTKFGGDAWDRVVAVLTTGQAWQFRPYKWSDPRTLFHHVKGFYVTWANDPRNAKIADWNVTELKIDPNRRHVDKQVVASFWKILDDWMLMNKPMLAQ